jgi:sentrin-specific protease 1
VKQKSKIDDYSVEGWQLENVIDCPQQNNGCDCGVFTILCADYLSDDLELQYKQSDISLWRKKIGIAFLKQNLPY